MRLLKKGESLTADRSRGAALWLGMAGGFEYLLQLILPVILVRVLSPAEFGEYRGVWLLAAGAMAIFPLFLPQSLFYFLPRGNPVERAKVLTNTLLALVVLGALAGTLLVANWASLPTALQGLSDVSVSTSLFVALWVVASMLDIIAVADGRASWQAKAIATTAVARALVVGATAVATKDVRFVLIAMCGLASLKILFIFFYLSKFTQQFALRPDARLLQAQIAYALPFAAGSALFLFRGQADQWIVAAYFGPEAFALVGIASVAPAVATVIRSPVVNALLSPANTLVASGDWAAATLLIRESYKTLSLLLVPILGLLFLCARDIIELVYTPAYVGAAPLMRIYLIGQLVAVFSGGHLLSVVGKGRAALGISALSLFAAVLVGIASVEMFGLVGGAVGSVVALAIGELVALSVVARTMKCSAASLVNLKFSARVVAAAVIAISVAWFAMGFLTYMHVAWRLLSIALVYAAALTCCAQVLGLLSPVHHMIASMRVGSRIEAGA